MKWLETRYVRKGRHLLLVISLVGIIVKVVKILLDPTEVLASSPPWTVTTEYGAIDQYHTTPHKGVDLALREGTPVKTIVEGDVIGVRDEGSISFGKSVRIKCPDGSIAIYGHLSSMDVHVGEHVEFGDVIGKSGNTGRSYGGHLHFQVNINGKPINPMPTIYRGAVRKALGGD
jgi:murein DD-endopeptidase MepM/ murein hydrolase activator NlpD